MYTLKGGGIMGSAVLSGVLLDESDIFGGGGVSEYKNPSVVKNEADVSDRRRRMEEIAYRLRHHGAILVTEDENGVETEVKLDYGKIAERLEKKGRY